MNSKIRTIVFALICLSDPLSRAQQTPQTPQLPPTPQPTRPATLSGHTTDPDDDAIPNAAISVDGTSDHLTTTSDGVGFFEIIGLRPDTPYRITITAQGFAPKTLSGVTLGLGQNLEIPDVRLEPSANITVDALTAEQAAAIEVRQEESQRVLGLIPNFYVVYNHTPYVPLPARLKYHLAFKAITDPATFVAAAFISGIDQAADTSAYVEGMKGYGQRFGANYADTASDILIGGAIFPALFHQDPRYFVQGTGTKKSRFLHAASAPFITLGDNGHRQFNLSSIGGDITSGALSNVYYRPTDRGAGLLFGSAAITTGGRVVNAILQEFLFGRVTTHSKSQ